MAAAALALAAVALGALFGYSTRFQPPAPSAAPTASQGSGAVEAPTVRVHVSGMVMSPGVVDVSSEAIVADAIEAAGGLRPEADVDQINLAAPVSAGGQIVVPGTGDAVAGQDAAGSGDGIISLNRASVTELETLPGVGPVLAERIVAFRDQIGGFETVEGLLEVPGIGEAKLASIRDLVRP